MPQPLKIHLDTDIGGDIDDLCALAMLAGLPEVEIAGITTVGEYGGTRAGSVQHVLDLAKISGVPVAAGADVACHTFSRTPGFLPIKEYWPGGIVPRPTTEDQALELLKANVDVGATIVGIGPYTNLALLEKRYPGTLARASLVLMGSYFPCKFDDCRQIPWFVEEYNFQADVWASQLVIDKADPIFVPINVSTKTSLRKMHLSDLALAGPVCELINHQANTFLEQFHFDVRFGGNDNLPLDLVNFLHDPLACAAAVGWGKLEYEEIPLCLGQHQGRLISRLDNQGKKFRFAVQVCAEDFNEYWFKSCCSLARRTAYPNFGLSD